MKQAKFIHRLTRVMESHKQRLFLYACYRLGSVAEAEDVLQDVYLRLLERQTEVEKVENLSAYIFRTLVNTCSSRAVSPRFVELSSQELSDIGSEPESFEEEAERITLLLALLPEEMREVIRLKIYGGLTFEEVGSTLGLSASTAKRRYYEGLELLRNKYNLLLI